jgi:hypothetical protein
MEESDEEDEDDEDYIQDEEVIRNTLRNQAMTTNVGKRKVWITCMHSDICMT